VLGRLEARIPVATQGATRACRWPARESVHDGLEACCRLHEGLSWRPSVKIQELDLEKMRGQKLWGMWAVQRSEGCWCASWNWHAASSSDVRVFSSCDYVGQACVGWDGSRVGDR